MHALQERSPHACENNVKAITISTSTGMHGIGVGTVELSTATFPSNCVRGPEKHGKTTSVRECNDEGQLKDGRHGESPDDAEDHGCDDDSAAEFVNVEQDHTNRSIENNGETVGHDVFRHSDVIDGCRKLHKETGRRDTNGGKCKKGLERRRLNGDKKAHTRETCHVLEGRKEEGGEDVRREEDDEEGRVLAYIARLPRAQRKGKNEATRRVILGRAAERKCEKRAREDEALWANVQRAEGYDPDCHAAAATSKHTDSEDDDSEGMVDEEERMRERETMRWWGAEIAVAAGGRAEQVEVSDACSVHGGGAEGERGDAGSRWFHARVADGTSAGGSLQAQAANAGKTVPNGRHQHQQQRQYHHHQQQQQQQQHHHQQQGVAVLRRDGRRVRQRFAPECSRSMDLDLDLEGSASHGRRRGVEGGKMEWTDSSLSASLEERENGRYAGERRAVTGQEGAGLTADDKRLVKVSGNTTERVRG